MHVTHKNMSVFVCVGGGFALRKPGLSLTHTQAHTQAY